MRFRLTALAVGAVLMTVASATTSAQNPTLKTAMRDKLVKAQRLQAAVVAADYAAVEQSAAALAKISDTEFLSWQPGAEPEYKRQAALFAFSLRGIRDAAIKHDVDATLAQYAALVSSCTRCHAHVRRAHLIVLETPARQ